MAESGLWRTLGKRKWVKAHRGFESLLLRQMKKESEFDFPEAPTHDAVILVEVTQVKGVEDPRLVQELKEIAKKLKDKPM